MVYSQTQRLSQQSQHLRKASGTVLRTTSIQCSLFHGAIPNVSAARVRIEGALSNDRLSEELLHAQQASNRQDLKEARQE